MILYKTSVIGIITRIVIMAYNFAGVYFKFACMNFRKIFAERYYCDNIVMLWCHAIMDDVGDHLMPEQSVLSSPDDLCRAHFVLPACRQAV